MTTDKARSKKRTKQAMGAVAAGLAAAAVVQELRKSPDERTWHGTVAGFVPYDLRFPPTLARVRAAFWSPDDPRLLMPRAFGVGWSPNLGRLVRLVTPGH